MKRGKLLFITGGARSGKSHFAEEIAAKTGKEVVYIATAQAGDEEMKRRIKKHQERRPGNWKTFEEPNNVKKLVKEIGFEDIVILIDCLTLLVSNHLLCNENIIGEDVLERKVLQEIDRLAIIAVQSRAEVIIVSNEVGMGLVPDKKIGRFYRDILGKANNLIAQKADKVFFMLSGIPIKVKG